MHIKSTKAKRNLKIALYFLLLCLIISIISIVAVTRTKGNDKERENYVALIKVQQEIFSERADLCDQRLDKVREAEEGQVSIAEYKQEITTRVSTMEELVTQLKELESQAAEKATRFVPDEVAEIYEQATEYASMAALEEQAIADMLQSTSEELSDIEQLKVDVQQIDSAAAVKQFPIFFSEEIPERIEEVYCQAEEQQVEMLEQYEYAQQLLNEIEELENKIQEHLDRAKNFDIMSEIALLSEEDEANVKLLAQLIFHEAGICDEEEQYKVACVVMNRTQSDLYPDTVRGVIYDTQYAKQYTSTGMFYSCTLPESTYLIAYDVYVNGVRVLPDNIIGQTGFKPSTSRYEVYEKTDWHYFFSVKE